MVLPVGVVQTSPQRIVLRHRPSGLALVLAAPCDAALCAALLVSLAAILRPLAVEGDARAGPVAITHGPLSRRARITFPLYEVAGALCRSRRIDRAARETWIAARSTAAK